jgi:class 3 adenylate cyclase/PAS domain-containing protein
MELKLENTVDELVRAGSLISRELNFRSLISTLVDQSIDISRSDLAALYLYEDPERRHSNLVLAYRRGGYDVARRLSHKSELVEFIRECGEAVVLLKNRKSPFRDIFLSPDMTSGIALPISIPRATLGLLILNSRQAHFYDRRRFQFLDSFSQLASGMLHNARLYQELQEYLATIEQLQRYQENIFSSMTNLLVTTDDRGKIRYYNAAAAERLNLDEQHMGQEFTSIFKSSVGRRILNAIKRSGDEKRELLGVEGIFRTGDRDIDFSLNVTPLKGRRGRFEGQTLLFTDQTRERELQERMENVVEERRLIKDMFSRYLSAEIVQRLVDSPEMTQLGGGKRTATIFFADIRGYTSFSEGKDPEYIIKVLNEYFNEAVEIVLQHRGYIDKFIGDCIMAAFGVPLQSEEQDAISAVSCALEIQKRVDSAKRKFFTGEASRLRIGIGMNSGPLVAGNLGGAKRMNYTVIGDTVNIAARLEGVAGPGEVIITQKTRDFIGDHFVVNKRKAVSVKGKAKPISIYAVKDKAG